MVASFLYQVLTKVQKNYKNLDKTVETKVGKEKKGHELPNVLLRFWCEGAGWSKVQEQLTALHQLTSVRRG